MISQFFVSGSSVAMILTMAIFLTQQFDSTLALATPKPSARRTRNPTFVPSQKPTITPSVVPTVTPQPTFFPTTTPAPTFTHSPSTFRPSFPTSQPSTSPSGQPTGQPSRKPSSQPTRQPTGQPSCQPTSNPSSPTGQPSRRPSSQPTRQPYSQPSSQPTGQPTRKPTGQPSRQPSCQPSSKPTQPTGQPTSSPTNPTGQPSSQPTNPTGQPTGQPSRQPSTQPTGQPSRQPSTQPTGQPTGQPSRQPTGQPSRQPSSQPSRQPSAQPSTQPTRQPTGQPTGQPSRQPTRQPTGQPSRQPSGQPSSQPSRQPTSNPTNPTSQPSNQPTGQPSRQPTTQPTCQPTSNPTNPTGQPSSEPTSPTGQPTRQPTGQPSRQPTSQPSLQPTSQPSSQPSRPTLRPTTLTPSAAPSGPTRTPTRAPTTTALPTAPSFKPTPAPSAAPTYAYHTQRYESVSSESFALFTPLWTGSHGSWLNIDPNGAYCDQFDSVPSYPVCMDGFLIPDAFTYKQKGSVPCPAVQCIKKVAGVNNCSYTPSDTFDYLPPAPTTTLDSDTICAAPSEDSYFSPGTLTLDQGIPPFFTPVTPVKLNIRGVVTAQLRDKCLPVENAEIIAWQVDPTALERFTIESQRKHQLHDTNSGDGNSKEQNQDMSDRNDYAQSNVSSYTSLRDISCRGMQHSSANGSYVFHTLMPPSYGPPRHIMFTISAPGYATLTTRMYFDMDWRLQQLTTLHGEENTRIVDSPHIDLNLLNTSRSADTEYAFPGRVANDPRVAHVIFARRPSTQSLLVTGTFETVFNFVLSPLRADTAPPEDTSDMPPIDISGLWSEPSGGLVKVETTGITFMATQYPHPRSWVSVVGAIAGDTIRGVDFHQVTGSQSDKLFSGETYTPPTTLWTSGSSTGVIVPDDAFATAGFTSTQPLAVSLSWSGGGYDAVWSKVSGSAQSGYRFVKLLVTRETGGYPGGQLVINEIEIFEGILTERQQPRVKMTTPRFPVPQMVSCSTFSEQSKHCWRAFDGDVSANSAWVTKSVGSKDHILSSPQWITIDFGEGHSVQPTGLRIVCDAEHTAHPQGCPMTFSLLGSQDNKKFDVLFKTDMFDYANSYSNGGQMFHFLPEHSAGRMNQQRCGSCDSGPHFTCHIQAYDGTCNSKYCNLDGKCDEVPPCIAGEYMDFKFTSYTKPSFSCKQCAPGRFGNASGLISSYCSGLCTEGYYCPAGSTTATAQPCGGAHLFCPEGSGAPIQAAAGRETRNSNTSLVFIADKLDVVTRFATQSFEVLCSPGSYCIKGATVPCPVGRFGNQTGLQTALCSGDCNAGDYCPLGSVEPSQCEEGYYCSDGRTKTICPAGTYGNVKGLRDRTCTGLCSPGFYCEEGSVSPTSGPCPSGRYGSTAGLKTSQCSGLCEAGYYCPTASTRSTMHLCGGDDVYCPAGSETPLMVDRGYYSFGGTEKTHSSQILCEVGYYTTDGVKKSCPAGTFGNRTGLTFDVVIPDFTTSAPSPNPSKRPTYMPTYKPTFRHDPTSQPSSQPSRQPTSDPTSHSKPSFPTSQPSRQPTTQPTGQPSRQPTSQPSAQPSSQPRSRPTSNPSKQPTGQPTRQPTGQPSRQPTSQPSRQPTAQPSLHTFVSKRPTTPRPSAKPTQLGGTFQPTSTPSFAGWTKLPTMRPTTIEEGPLINILCSGQCTAGYYCPLNSTRSTQVPCPMGRYGSTPGLQDERCTGVCPLGHYCPLAATKPIPCPPGVFGNLTGLVDASCSDQCWLGGCSPNFCQQGYFCPLGSIAATQYSCGGVDVYCPTGSLAPTPVTEGYYTIGPFPKQSTVNRIAQVKCEVGHYCTGGVKSKCPPGVFGATEGLTTALCSGVCPRGFYCPEGTSNGTTFRCPAGRYGASIGLSDTSCSGTCSAGFHCPEASTSPTQLECAVFAKQTLPQTTFVPVLDGSYVTYFADLNTSTVVLPNSDIVVTALVNPNNVYCPEGSSYPLIVRPGYYTTGQNATTRFNQFPCPMGTYCVDGVINDCPAGRYGRAERLTTSACSGPCARGHYCPPASTTSTQRPCPAGRFGSVEGLSTPSCSGACLHPEQCSIGSVIAQPLVTV